MHHTRRSSSTKLPIQRKGTKYLVRAFNHINESVPILIALRDMLKLARNAKEAKNILKEKEIKINGKKVIDYHESIKLFNLLQADKNYILYLLPTKKFTLEESKSKDVRLCKVTGKRLLKNNTVQLNMHDGSNVMTKEKVNVNDSVYLDLSGKIKKVVKLEKGKEVFVMEGRHAGQKGIISSIEGKKANIQFPLGEVQIEFGRIAAL
jgi:small subunit ribosomal protein S4e